MHQWSKPCPGRDALREGKTEYEGKPCHICGSKRRYAASGACVPCHRMLSKNRVAPMPMDVAALNQAVLALTEWADEPPQGDIAMAIKFLLASIFQGTSGLRIANATDIPRGICYKYARRCRDCGLWDWSGGMDYEWATREDEKAWFALFLDAMSINWIIRRGPERKYYARSDNQDE